MFFSSSFNLIRGLADILHLASIIILILKIQKTRSAAGISYSTQLLYLIVFLTRYIDLIDFFSPHKNHPILTLYNTIMKLIYIGSSGWVVWAMKVRYKATWNAGLDGPPIEWYISPCALLAFIFTAKYTFTEVLWTFSILLEGIAIMPQLIQLQKTGEAETITTHYMGALGGYRGLYLLNWIYRYLFTSHYPETIAVIVGLIQTALYADFFYIYFTKVIRGKRFILPI